ncbi:hypothetical protein ACIHCM_23170 [Streptomyces sp. NPDC052023]|uniref:hypothetical protein n=1 Tax=Streptomyces sp. NPDC052023 TaxID=3365681 RepID=UPI0037D4028F
MDLRGRKLKLTAVAASVVLTLTGFSTGRHSGGTGGGGGGGGGCSSSGQDHDGSSSTSGGGAWSGSDAHDGYDDDDDYGGSSGGSGYDDSYDGSGSGGPDSAEPLRDASVRPVKCATGKAPYSRVEVTNPNASTATFAVDVSFEDREGGLVKQETWYVEVAGGDRLTVDIESSNISRAGEVAGCDVDEVAEPEEV